MGLLVENQLLLVPVLVHTVLAGQDRKKIPLTILLHRRSEILRADVSSPNHSYFEFRFLSF